MFRHFSLHVQKEVENLSLCKSMPILFSGFSPAFHHDDDVSGLYDYRFQLFYIKCLESVFRWRSGALIVLLEVQVCRVCACFLPLLCLSSMPGGVCSVINTSVILCSTLIFYMWKMMYDIIEQCY